MRLPRRDSVAPVSGRLPIGGKPVVFQPDGTQPCRGSQHRRRCVASACAKRFRRRVANVFETLPWLLSLHVRRKGKEHVFTVIGRFLQDRAKTREKNAKRRWHARPLHWAMCWLACSSARLATVKKRKDGKKGQLTKRRKRGVESPLPYGLARWLEKRGLGACRRRAFAASSANAADRVACPESVAQRVLRNSSTVRARASNLRGVPRLAFLEGGHLLIIRRFRETQTSRRGGFITHEHR